MVNDKVSKLSENDLQNLIFKLRQRLNEKDEELDKLYDTLNKVSTMVQDVIKTDYHILTSKKELEMIFDATDDYIVVLDKDNLIRRVNNHFCELVKKEHTEIIGTLFFDYFPDLPKEFKQIKIPEDKFIKTKFFSNFYNKYLMIKSRKLNKKNDPLVYVHITRDISNIKGENEC